mmetsp:Transcript_41914/g.64149  ORF Transcript_41914/g.64149 Transcript_41914/m.64149 type:complete len:103 (+) Transcript_41914:695-1003(+)
MRKELAADLIAGFEARTERKRDLSNHVATRHYRAPEIILQERKYDQATDMWGLGCILPELLFSTTKYRKRKSRQMALFPGSSCFPLSPKVDKRGKPMDDEMD